MFIRFPEKKERKHHKKILHPLPEAHQFYKIAKHIFFFRILPTKNISPTEA